jgi:hypothetical protein
MSFEVARDTRHPDIVNDGMLYDGQRHRVVCRIAGKNFGHPFGVDVAFADPIFGEPDILVTGDVLAFAGIKATRLRAYPIETHIAEKLHAFTMPRSRVNSRVKDLPDIALLASIRALDARRVRLAIEQTFGHRKTHATPIALPDAPREWVEPYATLARTDGLRWTTLEDVTMAARSFLEPALSPAMSGTWSPASWAWTTPATNRGA